MKNFTLINCTKSTNSQNENVYNITYSFIDEWNKKQTCSVNCSLQTDASTNNLLLHTMSFKVKDKNGKWNSCIAKNPLRIQYMRMSIARMYISLLDFKKEFFTKEGIIK